MLVACTDLKMQKKLFVKMPIGSHKLSCRFVAKEKFLFFFRLHRLIVSIKQDK